MCARSGLGWGILLLTGVLTPAARAAEYRVAPNGRDTSTGGVTTPWATLQYAADRVRPGDVVTVHAGRYTGFNIVKAGTPSAPITWKAQPGAIINKVETVYNSNCGINSSGFGYQVIDGFTIQPDPATAPWHAAIRLGGTGTSGQWVYGSVVRNCTCTMRWTGSKATSDALGIFTSWQDGTLVSNNTVTGCWDSSIYMSNSARNYTVRGNTCSGCGGAGIHNNGDLSQGAPGINYNALIEGNVIYDVNMAGGQAISCDGVQNSIIRNNLVYNAYGKGISLYAVNAAQGSKRNVVANNTVLTASNGGAALRMVDDSAGNTILNNILYTGNPTSASIDLLFGDLIGLTSDYNAVKDRFYVDGSKTPFSEWRTNYGQDRHSFLATPGGLFVNPSGKDYHLSAASPAIDAGTSLQAPAIDLDGNPRPVGAGPDIGAYERGTILSGGRRRTQ